MSRNKYRFLLLGPFLEFPFRKRRKKMSRGHIRAYSPMMIAIRLRAYFVTFAGQVRSRPAKDLRRTENRILPSGSPQNPPHWPKHKRREISRRHVTSSMSINWEAGIRTPISRSRVCGPTVGRPPKAELLSPALEFVESTGRPRRLDVILDGT